MKKLSLLFLSMASVCSASTHSYPYRTENFAHDFLLEDIVEYNVDEAEGTVTMLVKCEADQMVFNVQFYVENGVLTAGEYTISDSKQQGTVQKGYIGRTFIKPTFCTQMTEDGYFLIPAWFCEEGTVIVNFDPEGQPVITMNAKTAQGYEVEVSVNAQSTNLDSIQEMNPAYSSKAFVDGRFIISQGSHQYNAFGQEVK